MLMYLFPDLFNMDLFSIYYMPGPVLAAGYLRLHQTVMVSALTEPSSTRIGARQTCLSTHVICQRLRASETIRVG